MYIDIHSHNIFPDNPLTVCSVNVAQARQILTPGFNGFLSVGVHPWDVHETDSAIFDEMVVVAKDKRVLAIGECGLDKNSKATIKEQDYYFERQICISELLEKPLIIHCVAAFNEVIAYKKRLQPKQAWIIHGFRGKPQLAEQLLGQGFVLSFGEKYNPDSVAVTPIDKLCVETDESMLPVEQIYHHIALIKNCRPQELNAACRLLRMFVY